MVYCIQLVHWMHTKMNCCHLGRYKLSFSFSLCFLLSHRLCIYSTDISLENMVIDSVIVEVDVNTNKMIFRDGFTIKVCSECIRFCVCIYKWCMSRWWTLDFLRYFVLRTPKTKWTLAARSMLERPRINHQKYSLKKKYLMPGAPTAGLWASPCL